MLLISATCRPPVPQLWVRDLPVCSHLLLLPLSRFALFMCRVTCVSCVAYVACVCVRVRGLCDVCDVLVCAAGSDATSAQEVWFTALTVACLRHALTSLSTDWMLVERKAVRWLGRRCSAIAPDLEMLLAAAKTALGL